MCIWFQWVLTPMMMSRKMALSHLSHLGPGILVDLALICAVSSLSVAFI